MIKELLEKLNESLSLKRRAELNKVSVPKTLESVLGIAKPLSVFAENHLHFLLIV